MSSFWSATDNNNDKSGIYYSAVIGKLTDTNYEYVIRFNLYEDKRVCKLDEVFDIQVRTVEVKQEWLDQVDNTFKPANDNRSNVSKFPSLWDQRSGHGFREVFPGGKGGKKDGKGKDDTNNLGSWPWEIEDVDGNVFVPGPKDEHDFALAAMEEMAERDLGVGIDVDLDEIALVYAQKYGQEAAEAYVDIDEQLTLLEECDEPLLDLITQCYGLLSGVGQRKLETQGFK